MQSCADMVTDFGVMFGEYYRAVGMMFECEEGFIEVRRRICRNQCGVVMFEAAFGKVVVNVSVDILFDWRQIVHADAIYFRVVAIGLGQQGTFGEMRADIEQGFEWRISQKCHELNIRIEIGKMICRQGIKLRDGYDLRVGTTNPAKNITHDFKFGKCCENYEVNTPPLCKICGNSLYSYDLSAIVKFPLSEKFICPTMLIGRRGSVRA